MAHGLAKVALSSDGIDFGKAVTQVNRAARIWTSGSSIEAIAIVTKIPPPENFTR